MTESIAILDFGSQYTQLIARRIRENDVYCEILRHDTQAAELAARPEIRGIVLSGGPASVYDEGAPDFDGEILGIGIPVLGICYGMQLACRVLGATVVPASRSREYGATQVKIAGSDPLLEGLGPTTTVWMSHGDRVEGLGDAFTSLASSTNTPCAAVVHEPTGFRGLQFHPEVTHTPEGKTILRNFLFRICNCRGDWSLSRFTEETVTRLRDEIGDGHVVCGLSGGVDSSVVAVLLHEAIGGQLHSIFVDNGLLRTGERQQVYDTFLRHYKVDLRVADASDLFLERLRGVTDPEEKRKRIGHTFIEVFEKEARSLDRVEFLAQGTLYPDVIESISPFGPSVTIKSHHNVGGLPAELGFRLVEPLRFLFKDEVRAIGRELGLPPGIIERQPFPGPGLAIRILGEVTRERLEMLRAADSIVQEEIHSYHDYADIWQSFAVLLPVHTVGVMGDKRTYEHVIALRVVESKDGMTADWVHLPKEILARISGRISNEVDGVNRVVLDISSKPPSTIEWE